MSSPAIAGKKLVFAPIMRSGITFVEGMLELVPAARVAHIGLYPRAVQRYLLEAHGEE
jgi:uracil phosphoribosyltransferase